MEIFHYYWWIWMNLSSPRAPKILLWLLSVNSMACSYILYFVCACRGGGGVFAWLVYKCACMYTNKVKPINPQKYLLYLHCLYTTMYAPVYNFIYTGEQCLNTPQITFHTPASVEQLKLHFVLSRIYNSSYPPIVMEYFHQCFYSV